MGVTAWQQQTPVPHIIDPENCDRVTDNETQLSHAMVDKLQSELIPPHPSPEANSVVGEVTGEVYEYRHLIKGPEDHIWKKALTNYLGRLAQDVGKCIPTRTNTIFFVHPSNIPKEKKGTYVCLVADISPLKTEK